MGYRHGDLDALAPPPPPNWMLEIGAFVFVLGLLLAARTFGFT